MSFVTQTLLGAYGLLWQAALPVLRRNKRLGDGFAGRLSPPVIPEAAKRNPCIWIQAASGGEAKLASALASALITGRTSPEPLTVVCTTYTRQGLDILQGLAASPIFAHTHTLVTGYVPFDRPELMRQTVRALDPRVIVLLETELWPGLLHAARLHNTPVLLLNGRMTAKSLAGYRRLRFFWREYAPERILAVSDADAGRFAELFGKERVSRMRNIKFDCVADDIRRMGAMPYAVQDEPPERPLAPTSPGEISGSASVYRQTRKANFCEDGLDSSVLPSEQKRCLTKYHGKPRRCPAFFTVAFASVREEEEAVLLPVIAQMCALPVPMRIIIAPRHMHRVEAWKRRLAAAGLTVTPRSSAPHAAYGREASFQEAGAQEASGKAGTQAGGTGPSGAPGRSNSPPAASAANILLWDTFGELRRVYEQADEVFVGGSLAPLGGQNFLEAAAAGAAPLVGPHWENFFWAGDEFFGQGLGLRVASAEELADILSRRAAAFAAGMEKSRADTSDEPTAGAEERAARKQEVRRRFAAWLQSRTGGAEQAAEAVRSVLADFRR